MPDTLFGTASPDPASIVASRAGMRLALIAALQYLPARQRAVLILRDVLGWQAPEVAELLEISGAAVNSLLQRARARLEQAAPAEEELFEPADPDKRALLDRYTTAFQNADVTALMQLLTADAVYEMPPMPTWFAGRQVIGRFLASRVPANPAIPTAANGQPALATYRRDRDGIHHAHSIQVLTVAAVSDVSDVAIQPFELRRRQCYLKPCVRRSRRCVTHVTCANPLLADALWPCSLAQGLRERHVYDAKPPSELGFSEMGFR
jgi:RNA polymerase sigma-70 factor (ECF subfamily)